MHSTTSPILLSENHLLPPLQWVGVGGSSNMPEGNVKTKKLTLLTCILALSAACPAPMRGMPAYPLHVLGVASDCGRGVAGYLVQDVHPEAGEDGYWFEHLTEDHDEIHFKYMGARYHRPFYEEDALIRIGEGQCYIPGIIHEMQQFPCYDAAGNPTCRIRVNAQAARHNHVHGQGEGPIHGLSPGLPPTELLDGGLEEVRIRDANYASENTAWEPGQLDAASSSQS